MNRFQILKLPDNYVPIFAIALTPEEEVMVKEEVEGFRIQIPQARRRVQFPLFEIASNPTIPLTSVRERRFDLIERAQDLANQEIQFQNTSWVSNPADSSATAAEVQDLRDAVDRAPIPENFTITESYTFSPDNATHDTQGRTTFSNESFQFQANQIRDEIDRDILSAMENISRNDQVRDI